MPKKGVWSTTEYCLGNIKQRLPTDSETGSVYKTRRHSSAQKFKVKMATSEVKEIVHEDVKLPGNQPNRLAFVLYNVLTPDECKDFIDKTEKKGYEKALVNIGFGAQKLMTDVRNSDRCIIDSVEEADKIWQRIKSYIPTEWKGRSVMGLNERLRFLRYDKKQYFKPHFDGSYSRPNGEESFITVQAYLNEGFKGGSTTFLSMDGKERSEVVPKTGSVLVFQHNLYHEGSLLEKGRKYAVRTDVMYSPRPTTNATDSS